MADEQAGDSKVTDQPIDDTMAFTEESSAAVWDLNRKLTYAGEHYDSRAMNLNQKALADSQVQALFWQNIEERRLAAKLASQELLERQSAQRAIQDQHALAVQRDQQAIQHAATLNNVDYARARNGVQNDNEIAMKHDILSARTIEPTREETIQDATAAAVNQAVDTVSRAMVDRTQTSAANVSELSAARQVTDVNVLNTLSELAGIVNVMQTESASTQAAFQALSNSVAELVGVVQGLKSSA